MLEYIRKVVSTAEMVIRFEKPDGVRKLQFEFEDELKSVFMQPSKAFDPTPPLPPPGQMSIQQGVPPRWVLNDGRKTLLASDLSLNLYFNFEGGTPDQGVIATLRKHAAELDRASEKLIGKSSLLFAGIVLQINFVYLGPEIDIHRDVAEMLLTLPRSLSLNVTTASVGIGYRGRPRFDGLNFFYNLAPYRSIVLGRALN